MVIKQLGWEHVSEIVNHLKRFNSSPVLYTVVTNLLYNGAIFLISDDSECMICAEQDTKDSCKIHIYCTPEVRGKQAIRFVRKCQEWAKENTEFSYALNFVNKKDKHIRMLMPYVGASKLGVDDKGVTTYLTNLE